jgi:hypothetical protein
VRTLYGRIYMGNERTTFLIDADGKISHIFRKVKPAEHHQKVLAALGASRDSLAGRLVGSPHEIEVVCAGVGRGIGRRTSHRRRGLG